jgi:hypothetical protein
MPITLTPAQFLQRRPGGDYSKYVSYINRARSAKAGVPVSAQNPLQQVINTYPGFVQSPKQMQIAAHQAVADTIKQTLAANQAAQAAQQAQYETQAKRAQGYAEALASLTTPQADVIKSAYTDAADRLRAYGTGLTGAVADAQRAEAERTAQHVADITGGLSGGPIGYDPNALRNAAQMAGVVIPGRSLEEQAANAISQAGFARAGQVGQIGQIAQEYLAKKADLGTQLAAKEAELRATAPSLFRQEYASRQQQGRSNLATLLSAIALENQQAGTGSLINTRTAGLTGAYRGRPTVGNWFNPKSGRIEKIPAGGVIAGRGQQAHVTFPGKVAAAKGKAKGAATRMQSKTINGKTVLFDPVSGHYYAPGDTKTPIDPNAIKAPPKLTPDKVRTYRAKATSGVAKMLQADAKTRPAAIYTGGVSTGIPGWIMAAALRAEARNHPKDPAWANVLKPGWAAGK